MASEVEKLIRISISLLSYDPNYAYGENAYDAGDEYGYEYDYYANDDDSSWKVRRSAVKILVTFIKARINLTKPDMSEIIHVLTSRLEEHSENVKIEFISCLGLYLKNFIVDVEEESGGKCNS